MPTRDALERARCYEEVAIGFDEKDAISEAQRCLDCKNPKCVAGCPVNIDIPKFLREITEGKFLDAIGTIRTTNSLPCICGRVCPQETQCEQVCILAKKGKPVAIGALERFVADYERKYAIPTKVDRPRPTGKKVAIVGSGPSGLTAAGYLAMQGHSVTVFEAFHSPGGVLIYGIPEFRLPKAIVREEVNMLRNLDVQFAVNTLVGRTVTIDELLADGYSAAFLGPGAGVPVFMRIPGENLCGVCSANEFLTRVNLMKAYQFPRYDTPVFCGKRVAVIGGGNTAMDAARTALRMGPEKVYIIYRRSEVEMPARREEVIHAQEEGIEFLTLTNPVAYRGDSRGWVQEMEVQKQELSEPDESGRRRPVPIKGSEYTIPVDTVVVAVGAKPNNLLVSSTDGLDADKWGCLVVDKETQATSRPGVYAGGDIAGGESTVIAAMGQGRVAGRAIHEYITEK